MVPPGKSKTLFFFCLTTVLVQKCCCQDAAVTLLISPFTLTDSCAEPTDTVTMTGNVTFNKPGQWGPLVELVPASLDEEVETVTTGVIDNSAERAFRCTSVTGNTSYLQYAKKPDVKAHGDLMFLRITTLFPSFKTLKSNNVTYPVVREALVERIIVNNESLKLDEVKNHPFGLNGKAVDLVYEVDGLLSPYTISIYHGNNQVATSKSLNNITVSLTPNQTATEANVTFTYDVRGRCTKQTSIDLKENKRVKRAQKSAYECLAMFQEDTERTRRDAYVRHGRRRRPHP